VTVMQRRAFELQIDAPEVEALGTEVDVAAITARTLVVSGGQDLLFFQQVAEQLAGDIPGARRLHLDWAGHLPSIEDPAAVDTLLLEFLA
jgi:3-oxoadipate enol-lactonase